MESVITLNNASKGSKAQAYRHLKARIAKPSPVPLPLPRPVQFPSDLAPAPFTFRCQPQKPQPSPPPLYSHEGRPVPIRLQEPSRYSMNIEHEKKAWPENIELDPGFPRPIYDVFELRKSEEPAWYQGKEWKAKTRGEKQAWNEAIAVQIRLQKQAIEVEKDQIYTLWLEVTDDIYQHEMDNLKADRKRKRDVQYPEFRKVLNESWDSYLAAIVDDAFTTRPAKSSPTEWKTSLARAIRFGDEDDISGDIFEMIYSRFAQWISGGRMRIAYDAAQGRDYDVGEYGLCKCPGYRFPPVSKEKRPKE